MSILELHVSRFVMGIEQHVNAQNKTHIGENGLDLVNIEVKNVFKLIKILPLL